MRFERPWKVGEALEVWEACKEALEGGPGRERGGQRPLAVRSILANNTF